MIFDLRSDSSGSKMKVGLALVAFFVLGVVLSGLDRSDVRTSTPISSSEFGVSWLQDLEQAKQVSEKTGKPMFVHFVANETDKHLGEQLRTSPLLVECIEQCFVPVSLEISDSALAKKLDLQNAKSPIVRFLKTDESIIGEKNAELATNAALLDRLTDVLTVVGVAVPKFVAFAKPPSSGSTETAEFAMHCYWEGEAKLGSVAGVYSTRSGWRDGLEVVQLSYSPQVVDYQTLLKMAQSFDCASKVFAHTDKQFEVAQKLVGHKAAKAIGPMRDAKSSDQKYYLAHTNWKHLPLTELQATKLNAAAKFKKSAAGILSPRQSEIAKRITAALKTNPQALDGLTFLNSSDDLGTYQAKLLKQLAKLTESS